VVFRGYIQNGKVVTVEPVDLPNGTEVELSPRRSAVASRRPRSLARPAAGGKERPHSKPKSFLKIYENVIGKARGLPPDASRNVDHYLYGARKR
jgi:hypothetical protein